MKKIIAALGITSISFFASAQRCEVISVDHFGGNFSDGLVKPFIVKQPNGKFSFTVESNSTSGSINTSCMQTQPNGSNSAGIMLTYNSNATLTGQFCMPTVEQFNYLHTPNFFPQPNGDTIFIGISEQFGSGQNIAIQRRSGNGSIMYTKTYGGSGSDGLVSALPMDDGGFTIVAGTNSSDGDVGLHYGDGFSADIWVLRLDGNGDKKWGKVLGGSEWDLISSIQPGPDGSCYLFGMTESSDYDATGMKGGGDLYVVKLDSSGNKLWHRCLGGTGWDGCGTELKVFSLSDNAGGFYVLNLTASHDGDVQNRQPDDADFWLIHMDSLANIIWERTYGGPNAQIPSAFCRGADGSFWMGGLGTGWNGSGLGGMIDEAFGAADIWIAHADSTGGLINQRVLGNASEEYLSVLYPLSDGTVLAGGRYLGAGTSTQRSPLFPLTSEGFYDVFIARLGPGTTTVKEQMIPDNSWQVFPNPAKGFATVNVVGRKNERYSLEVTDMQGKVVYKGKFTRQKSITTNSWTSGTYLVTLSTEDGTTGRKKMTVAN